MNLKAIFLIALLSYSLPIHSMLNENNFSYKYVVTGFAALGTLYGTYQYCYAQSDNSLEQEHKNIDDQVGWRVKKKILFQKKSSIFNKK